jgi:hypothetical protein
MNILLLFVFSATAGASLSDVIADVFGHPDVAEFLLSMESEDDDSRLGGLKELTRPAVLGEPVSEPLVVREESEYSESDQPLIKRKFPRAKSLREAVLKCILDLGLKSGQVFVNCVTDMFSATNLGAIEQLRAEVLSFTTVPMAFHERLSRFESWTDMTLQVEAELAALDSRPDVTRRAFVWYKYCILKSRSGRKIPPCAPLRNRSAMTLKQNVRRTYIRSLL